MPRARFAEILRLPAAHDVEFVVVGMTAGIEIRAYGASQSRT